MAKRQKANLEEDRIISLLTLSIDQMKFNQHQMINYKFSSKDLSPCVANFKPSTLSWNNLDVHSKGSTGYFDKPKEPVHIIKKVSGQAKPGNLLAILGASGAGKTTLLNVLTGQNLNKLAIEGQVSLNNEPITIERLSSCSSYVQQDDLFFGVLTVREHLRFQLKLRSPVAMNASQINERVDRIIEKLGLRKVAENRIKCGTNGERLSGGELKRLSIATEVLTDPAILFCDEPTSGLDSFMAQTVVSVLKSLANEQRTIVCTIHQPSSEIFKMFDQIMLLAEGRVAFLGTADKALDFFSQLGYKCPSNYNPSDFFIQQLSIAPRNKEQCLSRINMICDRFEASGFNENLRSKVSFKTGLETNYFSEVSKSVESTPPSILTQFIQLVWRSSLINLRDPLLSTSRVVNTFFTAFLISLVYWNQDYNQEAIMNINGAIFLLIMAANLSSIFIVTGTFCMEMPIILREHAGGLYRISVYYLARLFSDLPYFTILPAITWSICYYSVGFYNDFRVFMIGNGISIFVVNAASGFGYFISTISSSNQVALEYSAPLMTPLILLGGTFLNSNLIPHWINWLKYFSWFYYANEILTVNQWRDVTHIDCDYETPVPSSIAGVIAAVSNGTIPTGQGCLVNGKQVIESVGFKESNLDFDYWMLSFVIVVFRLMAYIALVVRTKLRR
ncbi:protein white isoform X3 [Tetranychus urticae]|uniref:protein white isoform X3 n=1 Tax=Tetranychus urticae TaxID=32264 RepID=UPI000D64FE7A|nr:protein white isoform X3 [Tetranychus urticae]